MRTNMRASRSIIPGGLSTILWLVVILATWLSLVQGEDVMALAELVHDNKPWPFPWLDLSKGQLSEEQPVSVPDPQDNQKPGTIRWAKDHVVIKCNLTRENSEEQPLTTPTSGPNHSDQTSTTDPLSTNRVKRTITDEVQNALLKNALQLKCESHGPHKPLTTILELHDKRPLVRKHLALIRPGDSIDRLMFGGREPRWMDECGERPPENDTIVRLWLPPARTRNVQEILDNLAISYFNTSIEWSDNKLARRKRSIVFTSGRDEQLYKFQDSDKSTILFRALRSGTEARRADNNKNNLRLQLKKQQVSGDKWWKPKKTTFAFARAKGGDYNDYRHKSAWSKSRFIVGDPNKLAATVAPPVNQLETNHDTTTTTTTTPAPAATSNDTRSLRTIHEVAWDLYDADVRINIKLAHANRTIRNLEKHIQKVLEVMVLDEKYLTEPDVSEERRRQILEKRKWMPNFEELVVGGQVNQTSLYNITSGLYHNQTQALMSNMTRYIELFAVSVEQMMYDRRYLYEDLSKNNYEHYRALEKDSQTMLCEAKGLSTLLGDWNSTRELFVKLNKTEKPIIDKKVGMQEFHDKFKNGHLVRDQPVSEGFQSFESPLERAWSRLTPEEQNEKLRQLELLLPENMPMRSNSKYVTVQPEEWPQPVTVRHLTHPTHFWRDIMPLEQRQLFSAKERAIRDTSILKEMQSFLRSYRTLVVNNNEW